MNKMNKNYGTQANFGYYMSPAEMLNLKSALGGKDWAIIKAHIEKMEKVEYDKLAILEDPKDIYKAQGALKKVKKILAIEKDVSDIILRFSKTKKGENENVGTNDS